MVQHLRGKNERKDHFLVLYAGVGAGLRRFLELSLHWNHLYKLIQQTHLRDESEPVHPKIPFLPEVVDNNVTCFLDLPRLEQLIEVCILYFR